MQQPPDISAPIPASILLEEQAVALLAEIENARPVTGLTRPGQSTYPTFLADTAVIKFFIGQPSSRIAYEREVQALTLLTEAKAHQVPHLLSCGSTEIGQLICPYIIMTRLPGRPERLSTLSEVEQLKRVRQFARTLCELHKIPPTGLSTYADWQHIDIVSTIETSSVFPKHLLDQIPAFLANTEPSSSVFANGDIIGLHLLWDAGQFSGLIDWGDAIAADRHYELAKIHLDLFNRNKPLLTTFLDAYGWPVTPDFPAKCLSAALHRQAHCALQHGTCDVFYSIRDDKTALQISHIQDFANLLFSPET